ncbi:MAG: glycoside hydrolase family 97 protein [Pseudomonadota bacterium]
MFAFPIGVGAHAKTVTATSPDQAITLEISDTSGFLRYTVEFGDEVIVAPSRLGLLFKDHHGFDRDLKITRVERTKQDTLWEQPWGERRFVRDHHREVAIEVKATKGPERMMRLRFRLFNDGIGFRYEVPEQDYFGEVDLIDERTQFALSPEATAWSIPTRGWNRYEYHYDETPIGGLTSVHTPMTFRTSSGVHASIHEAALVDYAAMSLKPVRPGVLKADLSPWSDGILVKTQTPFQTPWRTLQIAQKVTGLLNSDLILNLNEPNALGDVSWVEAGKYAGIWWAMHVRDRSWGNDTIHGATTEETKRYMDFAAANDFIGVLVEGWNIGWDGDWFNNGNLFNFTKSYPDFDIEEIADYGRKKGVRLIGHHETSGDVTNYEAQLDDAFDLYAENNVRAVKTGYVADGGGIERIDENGIRQYEWHDGQFMVNHHLKVVREAAKHKIAVNPHEPIKDTGLRRTYPNWVSREGARGSEYDAWAVPPNKPEHTAILPFTRMLAGPMDYTPGIFDLTPNERAPLRNDMRRNSIESRIQTTLAKQLALYVVIYSPIQMVADLPENYAKHADAFKFIKDVPADWSQSIALDGEVGDFVTFARKDRNSNDWYVGTLTDEEARTISVPLDFLDEGTTYRAQLYRDGPDADWKTNPYAITIEERVVTPADTLTLPLGASGGAAVRLAPQ